MMCKHCLGCNKLELPGFRGLYKCNDAVIDESLKDKQKQYKQIGMDGDNYVYGRYRMANSKK